VGGGKRRGGEEGHLGKKGVLYRKNKESVESRGSEPFAKTNQNDDGLTIQDSP